MGSIQTKPDIVLQQTLEAEVVDDDTWLDTLVHDLATAPLSPARQNEVRHRLAVIPFTAILCAMDRARPQLTPVTEITLYEHWVACTETGPLTCAAWFNIGVLHGTLGNRFASALAYRKALSLRPDMYSAAVNLGLLQEAAGRPDNALDTWKRADQPDEARIALGIQQGRLLEKTGRLQEAEQALRRVLLTSADQPDVLHHWVHIRQKTCLWPVTPTDIPGLPPETLMKSAGPLGILAMTDDIDLQREAAGAWIARKTAPAPRRLAPPRPYGHQRIRIGYVSSDFCSHAMSYLITELFERHDRARFEVFGYCSSAEDGSDLRKRVLAAFDHCRLIRDLADEQAAQVIRDDEIDILVDLNGITDGSRLGVLRWRPAPIQATYLGFIGPLPMPELDYMLADSIAIPPEHETDYQPAPLAIARSYQANDSQPHHRPPG